MKKWFVFSCLCFYHFSLFGQLIGFKYTDVVFMYGATKSTNQLLWDFNGGRILEPRCYSEFDAICEKNISDHSKSLDSLTAFLLIHPELKVEIRVHTDSRGNDSYNLKLSEFRAKTLCSYLISKGIFPEQLIPKGMGETLLQYSDEKINSMISNEEKELAHQKNRRMEIKIDSLNKQKEYNYFSPYFLDSVQIKNLFKPVDSLICIHQWNLIYFENRLQKFINNSPDSLVREIKDFRLNHQRSYVATRKSGDIWLVIFSDIYTSRKKILINLTNPPQKTVGTENKNTVPGIIYDFD